MHLALGKVFFSNENVFNKLPITLDIYINIKHNNNCRVILYIAK